MEKFLVQPGDQIKTTSISPLRGLFFIVSIWREGVFCRYDVATEKDGAKVSTLRNKDIQPPEKKEKWTLAGLYEAMQKDLTACFLASERINCRSICGREIKNRAAEIREERDLTIQEINILARVERGM